MECIEQNVKYISVKLPELKIPHYRIVHQGHRFVLLSVNGRSVEIAAHRLLPNYGKERGTRKDQ